jgi:quercetin dioxygenase-like cupin family protein
LETKNISDIEFTSTAHSGHFKKVIFESSEMASSVTQVAYAELEEGEIVEEHSHNSMEEIFLVLEGKCEFSLNGVLHILVKDSVIKVSPKIKHSLKAMSNTKLYYFGVSTLE